MSQQPEAKFKAKLKECFEEVFAGRPYHWFPIVASMMQMAGVPDTSLATCGRSAWIEAKVNDGWLRPSQQIEIPKMDAAGHRVVVLWTDMRVEKAHRAVHLSDFDAKHKFCRDRVLFRWHMMRESAFWSEVLGVSRG